MEKKLSKKLGNSKQNTNAIFIHAQCEKQTNIYRLVNANTAQVHAQSRQGAGTSHL